MKVCIVGASGNLGQYMVQHALDRGYAVVGVCREQSVGKLGAFEGRITVFPGATNNRAVIETLRGLKLRGDVLHAHDYHSALAVAYLKTIYSADSRFSQLGSVLTAHDLSFQGLYGPSVLSYTGLPPDSARMPTTCLA